MKNEIIIYQSGELAEHIEVRLDGDTVWLNRQQLSLLFERDVKTIGKHINNVLNEELAGLSVVANFATTASDGKVYQTEHYNLDMIISIGYRVKSQKGIQFRIWANNVLKDYLLKGYSINNRMNRIEDNIESINRKLGQLDLQINTQLVPNQGIFFDGQVFDAYAFFSSIIKRAKKEIILIDNYIDENTLTHLSKKENQVKVILYTKSTSQQLTLDINKANEQYGGFEAHAFAKSHDRFLIIDGETVYHIGASLKDLGKKPVVSLSNHGLLSRKWKKSRWSIFLRQLEDE
ncbi:MAG: virulence RhuM family protein [Flavobacteriales bacterium]|nr:virulence RhuM family protein [Flavobacteriales bacterium]